MAKNRMQLLVLYIFFKVIYFVKESQKNCCLPEGVGVAVVGAEANNENPPVVV